MSNEKVIDPEPDRRWGFMELQDDGTEVFVALPKTPLLLGGYEPPVMFMLHDGPRLVIKEPLQPVSQQQDDENQHDQADPAAEDAGTVIAAPPTPTAAPKQQQYDDDDQQ